MTRVLERAAGTDTASRANGDSATETESRVRIEPETSRSAHDEDERERERERCPECKGSLTRARDRGETVCGECGLVVSEGTIDRGPEWRAFDAGERERRSRVGAPMTRTLHDEGLTTTIGWRNEDAHGRAIPAEKRARIERLRTWQQRLRTSRAGERTLQAGLGEIVRMASALGVPRSVREVASVIQRRAGDVDLLRGRSVEDVASAALYAACRLDGVPRSLDGITGVSRAGRTETGRAYRYPARELELEMEPTDPRAYLRRYCSDLDLPERVETRARGILDAAAEAGLLSGRSPTGSAAAATYAACLLCEEKRSQAAIAEAAGVSEVTIRNRYREHLGAVGVLDGV